jgi:CheY-like chemotaxis protein
MVDRVRPMSVAKSVLLVDDEHRFRGILAGYLRALGHPIREAATVAEACRALAEAPIDVLVLDINLPDETGWSVLRWLEQAGQQVAKRPVVVIVSAVPPSEKRLAQFQPDAVLNKPFPIDTLARLVESAGQPVSTEVDWS